MRNFEKKKRDFRKTMVPGVLNLEGFYHLIRP
jgi:hypothetical protein